MAARFVFQKLASRVPASGRLLGAHASASAGAPATCPVTEGGVETLGNLFHGAAINPSTKVPVNHGIHAYAARYFNTITCSPAAAKNELHNNRHALSCRQHLGGMKSASVDSVRGAKRTFSSNPSTMRSISREDKSVDWKVEWEAKATACRDRMAAFEAEMAA
ncbi:hypothetical protein ACP70R_001168 [Stipagrostis hirtigluma subsp. patula]